ncbi:hypothetical protein AAFF_G00273150 [Aldrovandia affinis]|uniref:Uncharacterized protein n=1 Tax=Aldrovandia affinis TaxID=143900 RepID=A0AAD7WSJ9_9TELE|nr:hypothetical protein AAFF_G00273150 [Aldrovandia affinis]
MGELGGVGGGQQTGLVSGPPLCPGGHGEARPPAVLLNCQTGLIRADRWEAHWLRSDLAVRFTLSLPGAESRSGDPGNPGTPAPTPTDRRRVPVARRYRGSPFPQVSP